MLGQEIQNPLNLKPSSKEIRLHRTQYNTGKYNQWFQNYLSNLQ